jgi:hypothetical protein
LIALEALNLDHRHLGEISGSNRPVATFAAGLPAARSPAIANLVLRLCFEIAGVVAFAQLI